jgi:spoIIIJ-associated protein
MLAERMAERVMEQGQPYPLEPMSPYDRRIVHMALAEHPQVMTESTGEGEERRVVIMPRQ